MRICLCTISYREKLLDVALDAARAIGFGAVELWGREPHVSETYDESRVRGVRQMVEERGLRLPVFGSYLVFGRTQSRDDSVTLADALHTAHGLRAPIMRVWASDVGSRDAKQSVWDATVAEIQEACDRAAKMSVMFAAEMHDDTLADTGPSARRLVEEVGRANFRLNFQVGNLGVEDQHDRLETVLPYVVHVHCQNFRLDHTSGATREVRVHLGEGVVDYGRLISRLTGAGYAGHFAVEFAAEEGPNKEDSLRRDLLYLRSLLD
ncbi:MAG: sugar phosphate isomerase/epimerase [Armatimonadetes bacterium]|nr:sugar phosphate isomerase/epimerase [Armatimonadota bacterium]